MQKKLNKRLVAILLVVVLFVVILPARILATDNSPEFATKDELMSNYSLDGSKIAANVRFGVNGRLWGIAGADSGISGDNIVLFSKNPFDNIEYGLTNEYSVSNFTKAGGLFEKYLNKDTNTYFSDSEIDLMNTTMVSTPEYYPPNKVSQISNKLYLASAIDNKNENAYYNSNKPISNGASYITLGTKDQIHIVPENWKMIVDPILTSHFWLRSYAKYTSYPDSANFAKFASYTKLQIMVGYSGVKPKTNGEVPKCVLPATNLNMTDVLFGSYVPAVETVGKMTFDDAFNLRYASNKLGVATISIDKSKVHIDNVPAGTYLVVQKENNAWSKIVSDTADIMTSDIDSSLTDFSDCKIWLEKSDKQERIITATMAIQEKHVHLWSSVWGKNESQHWHECENANCPITDNVKKDSYGAHEFDVGVIVTSPSWDEKGEKLYTCKTCNYNKKEVIPPLKDGYDVDGTITGADETPTAALVRDGVHTPVTVSGDGNNWSYHAKVPSGEYNLIVTAKVGGKVVTVTVLVNVNQDVQQDVMLPNGTYSSIVTTEGDKVPNVEAGGLDTIAGTIGSPSSNTQVLIELKVKENETTTHASDINNSIYSDKMVNGIMMDLDLFKTVNQGNSEKIKEIEESLHGVNLITVIFHLPQDIQGKKEYAIYRYHGTQVDKITETPNGNGEYITVDSGKTIISAHLNKFSSYAIAYLPNTYTITASSDLNGSISPSGTVTITEGNSQIFNISANKGYKINSVLVDGVSVDTLSTYTFENVTANHSIRVDFQPKSNPPETTFTVDFNSCGGNSIAKISNVLSGSKIPIPTTPIRSGYTFIGWYTDINCKILWDFSKDVINHDMVLYAGWKTADGQSVPPASKPALDNLQTGDNSDLSFWLCFATISLLFTGAFVIIDKKKKISK